MSTMPAWKSKIANIWHERQKVSDWRLPFAMFICGLLAYAAAFAWHMLTTFDLVNLIRDVNFDDSFYYFQIAYNLSQGKFSTFDGGITQTNGYHPVWMLFITPFYWIFDKEAALFGIKAFEIMLVAGGAVLIAAAAWLSRLAWPLLFAALPMLYSNPLELLYGLEAAAAMFALSLLILAICLYMRDPQRWQWHFAAIAFALPWVRLEYIAISLAATAAICAIEWSRQERRSLRLSELAILWRSYIPLIGAAAGMLAYFAYNRLVFGGILPVSAATWRAWTQDFWAQDGGYDFMQSLGAALQFVAFDYELLIAFEICAYLLIVWWLALRSKERRVWLLVAFLVGMFSLAAGHIAKFAQVVLISYPEYFGDGRVWYFVPAYIMTALINPVRLYIAIYLIRRFIAPRGRATAKALSVGVIVIGAAVLLARAGFAEPFRWVDSSSASTKLDWNVSSYMRMQVMNRALPESSVIGSLDAGVIGYFSRFPVVNLDGLVNSYEYLDIANRDSLAMWQLSQIWLSQENNRSLYDTQVAKIIRRYGVTHFANIRWRDESPNNVIFQGAWFDAWEGHRQFNIWPYDPSPSDKGGIHHSHQVWDNLKPHFDYSSNGVGIVLAGRAAQAFAKNCPSDNPLVWTWSDRKRERILIEPSLYRSRANMCVAQRLLPRGDGQPSQVKIAPLAYLDNLTADREPIIRSDFDVHLIDGSLIYAKSQCRQADVEATFFANIYPVDADDLSYDRRQYGYDIIDLNFDDYGAIAADGNCWAALNLPNYPIAEIHAGQYAATADGFVHIWEGTYRFNE